MDIRRYAVEETSTITLHGADDMPLIGDDGKSMTVTLYGPGSKAYVRAQTMQQNRLVERLKRKANADISPEDKAREQAEFLAGCTKEFSDNVQYDTLAGESMHYAIYADASIGFIAEQVGKHLGDWANFKRPSAKDSASTSGTSPG